MMLIPQPAPRLRAMPQLRIPLAAGQKKPD